MTVEDPGERWGALIEAWRSLLGEPHLTALLARLLATARELAGARYAAVGILTAERTGLTELLVVGEDERTRRSIAELRRGRGVLGVPLMVQGQAWGSLYLADKENGGEFDELDQRAATILADWAAIAIDNARSYGIGEFRREEIKQAVRGLERLRVDRLRSSLAAADAERERWARELHEGTLQGLGGLRELLSAVLRRDEQPPAHEAIHDAVQQVAIEIETLRSIVDDLRPAALDGLGLCAAIEALLDRHRDQGGLTIDAHLAILSPADRGGRLGAALETAAYRIVQDALTNVVRHVRTQQPHARRAHAQQVRYVRFLMREDRGELLIELQDDGDDFDMAAVPADCGLMSISERVARCGGELSIERGAGGTLLSVRLPVRRGTRAR